MCLVDGERCGNEEELGANPTCQSGGGGVKDPLGYLSFAEDGK